LHSGVFNRRRGVLRMHNLPLAVLSDSAQWHFRNFAHK
jgi:hypothetical protein